MTAVKAMTLLFLGMLSGLGVAMLIAAHLLDPGRSIAKVGTLNTFLMGVLLVVVGLVVGIEVARGRRTRRLRTAMGGIVLLAILLGLFVELRRRAERFRGLALHHTRQAKQHEFRREQLLTKAKVLVEFRGASTADPSVSQAREQATALGELADWHGRMAQDFRRAASRPWLPLPNLEPSPKGDLAASEAVHSTAQ